MPMTIQKLFEEDIWQEICLLLEQGEKDITAGNIQDAVHVFAELEAAL